MLNIVHIQHHSYHFLSSQAFLVEHIRSNLHSINNVSLDVQIIASGITRNVGYLLHDFLLDKNRPGFVPAVRTDIFITRTIKQRLMATGLGLALLIPAPVCIFAHFPVQFLVAGYKTGLFFNCFWRYIIIS